MNLPESFLAYIRQHRLFTTGNRLLLAVSGGIDSVVLSALCREGGFTFAIAHCNFQLRGEESARDEAFARALAEKYKVPFLVQHFNTHQYAETHKLSVQVAARELRYSWFNDVANETQAPHGGFDFIVTAHHADDNIETMLMNFFKGTGIAGLRGILPKQGKLVRPLLFCGKQELLAFALRQRLDFVEDSSNSSEKYTRNYFRLSLIPALEKVYPSVKENLASNLERFKQVESLYNLAIEQEKKKIIEQRGDEVHLPVMKLQKAEAVDTILFEIIKAYGFSAAQVPEVKQLLNSESGKFVTAKDFRIIRNRNWLIIAPVASTESRLIVIEKNTRQQIFPNGELQFKITDAAQYKLVADEQVASLDASLVKYPLILRTWKQGDYFYPLGMKKKKKLSRFFIDQKYSKTEKEKIWILEMNKKIVWVVGKRIDDRFKLLPSTKEILRIHFTPKD